MRRGLRRSTRSASASSARLWGAGSGRLVGESPMLTRACVRPGRELATLPGTHHAEPALEGPEQALGTVAAPRAHDRHRALVAFYVSPLSCPLRVSFVGIVQTRVRVDNRARRSSRAIDERGASRLIAKNDSSLMRCREVWHAPEVGRLEPRFHPLPLRGARWRVRRAQNEATRGRVKYCARQRR